MWFIAGGTCYLDSYMQIFVFFSDNTRR